MTAPDPPMAEDVSILGTDLSDRPGLPLIVVVRNERAFLPEFLDHYRALGIARFFILDDASEDDTRGYLAGEGDVCLLGSRHRYGDRPAPETLPDALRAKPDIRMIHQWRTGLMNRFAAGTWVVQCDIDEFLLLPDGMTLPDIVARLERDGASGVWGGMMDLYPREIADLSAYPESGFTWPAREWFFDGARHFSLRADQPPLHHYAGVRHRLDVAFAGKPDIGLLARLKLRYRGRRKSPSGTLVKPILQRWERGAFYHNSHRTTLRLSDRMLLPLLHYRYTPAMLRKLEWATQSGGYSKGNADYARVEDMLAEMQRQEASFLAPVSVPLTGFDAFARTGNALI